MAPVFARDLAAASTSRSDSGTTKKKKTRLCPRVLSTADRTAASLRSWSHVRGRGANIRRRLLEPATHRQSACAVCGLLFRLCAACDYGQVTCCDECGEAHRRAQVRAAGRAYRASRRGRFNGAERQRRYRGAKSRDHFVTHQPATSVSVDATVASPSAVAEPVQSEVESHVIASIVSIQSTHAAPRATAAIPEARASRCARCLAALVPHASRGRAHGPRYRRRGGAPRHPVGPPRR